MFAETGKGTPAKFRSRLRVIREAAANGVLMAQRWNPKGRNYELRREMVAFFTYCDQTSELMLQHLDRQRRR